jgi:hypothetical protein
MPKALTRPLLVPYTARQRFVHVALSDNENLMPIPGGDLPHCPETLFRSHIES